MKTIAVSDKAYARLVSWKDGRADTFSSVIERLVPPKGTLAALQAAQSLPELGPLEFQSLEEAINATRHEELSSSWR